MAAVFLGLWRTGLERFDELKGLDWSWLIVDGTMANCIIRWDWGIRLSARQSGGRCQWPRPWRGTPGSPPKTATGRDLRSLEDMGNGTGLRGACLRLGR